VAPEDYIIHEEDVHLISQELTNFINESEAKCALLVNRDGHLVSQEGFTGSIDTTALSALLAGSVASTRELARLSGEPEFAVLLFQGETDSIYVSMINDQTIIGVVFDDRTTVGMIRLYTSETAKNLAQIFEESKNRPSSPSEKISEDYSAEAEDRLDELFGSDSDS